MSSKVNKKPMFVSREAASQTTEYKNWLTELKKRYNKAQVRAAVKVNGEMLNFYWELGRDICAMSKTAKYGDGLLKNVTLDLQAEFPGDSGLSLTNIKAARRWYKTYSQWLAKSQQFVDFFCDKAKEETLTMPYFLPMYPGVSIYSLQPKLNLYMKRCFIFQRYVNTVGVELSWNIITLRGIIPLMPER